jgi:DNA-binding transcriptional LysR family regulator
VELRQLRLFLTLAETLHFGRAAQQLAMSQPALSQQIQTLERQLGAQLLLRRPRAVALTAAGVALAAGARDTLAAAEEAVSRTQQAERSGQGRLRIGSDESCTHLLRVRLSAVLLMSRSVNVVEQLDVDGDRITSGLASGVIDVGIVRTFEPEGQGLTRLWQSGSWALHLQSSTRSADEPSVSRPVDLEELTTLQLIVPSARLLARSEVSFVDAVVASLRRQPLICTHFGAGASLAAEGLGALLAPSSLFAPASASLNLRVIVDAPPSAPVFLLSANHATHDLLGRVLTTAPLVEPMKFAPKDP